MKRLQEPDCQDDRKAGGRTCQPLKTAFDLMDSLGPRNLDAPQNGAGFQALLFGEPHERIHIKIIVGEHDGDALSSRGEGDEGCGERSAQIILRGIDGNDAAAPFRFDERTRVEG